MIEKRNLLVYIFLVAMLALIPYASATAAITMSGAQMTWAKDIDSLKEAQFTIHNTGTENLTGIVFDITDLVNGAYTIPKSFITMPSPTDLMVGQLAYVNLSVSSIPTTQQTGVYTGTMTAFYGTKNITSIFMLTVRNAVKQLTIVPSSITVGSSTSERESFYTQTFTIRNTGDYPITNIIVSSNANSKYNATFTNVPSSLAVGQEQLVTLTAYIPDDKDSGEEKIGTITVTSSEASTSADLLMNAQNMLEIYDLDVIVDGKSDDIPCSGVVCGVTSDEKLKPDSKVDVKITLRNLYQSSNKVDIEDITIDAIIEEIDDGDDLEPTADISSFNLRYDKKVEKTLTFNIPSKVDEDTYKLVLDVEGDDENGATHKVSWIIYLEVAKESHDLVIKELTLSNSEVSCDRTTELKVSVFNRGLNDEDQGVLTIENKQLGIGRRDDFTIDEGEKYTQYFTLSIPSSAVAGNYNIIAKVYYDNDELTDTQVIPITVSKCETPTPTPTPTPTQTPQNITVVVQPTPTPTTGGVVAQEVPFTESTLYIVLLVIAVIALLIIIFIIIAKLIR